MGMLQNLKYFVDSQLSDILSWGANVRVPGDREKSRHSDEDRIEITTPFNHYGLLMQSTYLAPPLGRVQLHHGGKVAIEGQHKDDTWSEIARYVHAREIPAAQAAAHAKVVALAAQGESNELAVARVRVAELEALASKWKLPEFVPGERADDGARASAAAAPPSAPAAPSSVPTVVRPFSPDGREPYQGQMVRFVPNPGEHISGMTEVCAIVTRVTSPTIVNLLVLPDGGDPFHRDNLQRRIEGAKGQGWDFAADDARHASRVRHLEEAIERMTDEGNAMLERIAALEARAGQWTEEELAMFRDQRGKPPIVTNKKRRAA